MQRQTHAVDISKGYRTYCIEMNGTMDGENTRSPVGYQVYDQAFEPNLWVRMANIGQKPVVNPWLMANGKDWRTVSSIVQGAVADEMTDAEKALALWTFQRGQRFHASPYDRDNGNVVKLLNVYGYSLCGDDSYGLADLLREAGLRVRAGKPIGHTTTEAFFDGMWHLLDGDEHVICLMRDNRTVAGEEEIVRDHDLMKRTHVYGILKDDDRQTDEHSAALFPYEGERPEEKGAYPAHEMKLTLRPGETLEWRWDGQGKFHGRENMGSWRNAWTRICNGRLIYEPDVLGDAWRFGAVDCSNVPNSGRLRAEEGAASAVFEINSPYAIVGGHISGAFHRASFQERAALFVSFDRENWTEVWTAGELGDITANVSLDRLFPHDGEARYGYFVRVDFGGDGIQLLTMQSDLQMAPLSLPGVRLGKNEMVYVDESDARTVKITHAWRERDDHAAPPAPVAPVFPPSGSDVEGTRFAFEWDAVVFDDPVVDYHFELSRYPDMRCALSPNFEKLTSRTAQHGVPRYEIPYVGLLNPGETYYWRVRTRSSAGVWSDWSAVWTFTPQAPGVPLNGSVTIDGDRVGLSWEANSEGRLPVQYIVYGSDERGFTASDEPYPVAVARGQIRTFEANRIGETTEARFDIAPGERVYAFYRIVALDERGNTSGPSDLIEVSRPHIWTLPVKEGRVGEAYHYRVQATRSIGDLRTVTIEGNPYNPAFRNADEITFELVEGPDWMALNRQTGELSGRPAEVGTFDVTVRATRNQGGEDVQRFEVRLGA